MAQLVRDTRFALRMLRKRWGITLVAVASLAVAIGGNTAVFSLVSAVVLQPTSVVEPERVVLVQERLKTQSINLSNFTVIPGDLGRPAAAQPHRAVVGRAPPFAQRGLRGPDRTEPVNVSEVTPGFFDLVGESTAAGPRIPRRRGRRGRRQGDGHPLGVLGA